MKCSMVRNKISLLDQFIKQSLGLREVFIAANNRGIIIWNRRREMGAPLASSSLDIQKYIHSFESSNKFTQKHLDHSLLFIISSLSLVLTDGAEPPKTDIFEWVTSRGGDTFSQSEGGPGASWPMRGPEAVLGRQTPRHTVSVQFYARPSPATNR